MNNANTFNGAQTVNGNVTATDFVGSGAGLTGVNASTLGGVPASSYALLSGGNAFSGNQTVSGNVTANFFYGDGSNLMNVTASNANYASSAGVALSAGNSSSLGDVIASNYARLDISNIFNGTQTFNGFIITPFLNAINGSFSGTGQGGGPVLEVSNNGPIGALSATSTGGYGIYVSTTGGNLLLGQVNGVTAFSVDGSGDVNASGVSLGASGVASGNGSFPSFQLDQTASAYNGSAAVPQLFRWQAEPTNAGTNNASGSLNLLFGAGGNTPSETGLSLNANGTINFATGQTFPGAGGGSGTISGVTAGTGLSGGGSSGNVTLSLASNSCAAGSAFTALPFTCAAFAGLGSNSFTGNQSVSGTVTATAFAGDGSALANVNALTAASAASATNAGALGGQPPSFYATTGANTFTGSQMITGGYLELDNTNAAATTGVITMGGTAVFHNYGSQNMFVGENAGNFSLTGNYNNGFGYQALHSNTSGFANTAVGSEALQNNANGFDNTAAGYQSLNANTAGGYNTAFGYALIYNTTGSNNTAVGFQAGVNQNGANANTTGSNNTFLGYSAGPQTPNQLTNATAIGSNAVVNASNALVLGSISGLNGASNNVNVGIGTSTPGYSLDVQGGQINASGGLCIAGVCQTSWPSGGSGTITGVSAGSGLSGGGTSGNVSLSVDGTVARTNASNAFTGSQTVNGTVAATAFSGDGSALTNVNAATAAVAATATNALALGGQPASSYATTGANTFTATQTMPGLQVNGTITSQNNSSGNGVYGSTVGGSGVLGYADTGVGVEGSSANAAGVLGITASALPGQAAGIFNNQASQNQSGNIVLGQYNGTTEFTVDAKGDVTANGTITGSSFTGNGAGLTGVQASTLSPGATIAGSQVSGAVASATNAVTAVNLTGNISDSQVNNLPADLAAASASAVTTAENFAATTFLPLAGGTLTGNLSGTGATFSGTAAANQVNAVSGYLLGGTPVLNASVPGYGGPSIGNLGGTVSVGLGAGPVYGFRNTYVGYDAGEDQPGSGNDSSNNTFVGSYAGFGSTSGFTNSFFGASAGSGTTGYQNVFLGYAAGSGVTTGSNNTMVGTFAGGLSGPLTGSQNIYIGEGINPPLSEGNAIRIGVSGTQTAAYVAGVYGGATSSGLPVFVDSTGHLGTGGGSVLGDIPAGGVTNAMLANPSLTVSAGAGLTGGGAVALGGATTLSIAPGAISDAMLANPSLTVAAGPGVTVTGGSPVSLGGTVTVSLAANTCAAGSAVTAHPFTCSPFATLASNTFTGNQTISGYVSSSGLYSSTSTTSPAISGSSIVSTSGIGVSGTGTEFGVEGTSSNVGLFGTGGVGVDGQSNTAGGSGVSGYSSSNIGVFGITAGTAATSYGVEGLSNNTGVFGQGSSVGVTGESTTPTGTGVYGWTLGTSTSSAAAIFDNAASTNSGNILLGQYNGTNEFTVDAKGDVTANGNVLSDGTLTIGNSGTPIVEHLSQVFTLFTIPAITPGNCATLAPFTLTGASDGDTIAFGIKNALITAAAGYVLDYFGWISAANTITIRVCNTRGPTNPALTGSATNTIRADVWKH